MGKVKKETNTQRDKYGKRQIVIDTASSVHSVTIIDVNLYNILFYKIISISM